MTHGCSVICSLALLQICGQSLAQAPREAELSRDQQLIVAAFRLDVDRVRQLADAGADVNVRFGKYDRMIFRDKRSLGYSKIGSNKWTALQAVASSLRAPDPEQETENTTEGRDKAAAELKRIDPKLIKQRDERRVAIAKLLIAAGANLDANDGYGATALAGAIYLGYDDLALLLIESNAAVNTKTGVYIDGPGDLTPLHCATRNPRIVKALLQKGADASARTTGGDTPLHWAVLSQEPSVESVRLLIAAGADVNARDNEGRTPLSWVPALSSEFNLDPNPMAKREIRRVLLEAGAK
jgi:hypothetical protein